MNTFFYGTGVVVWAVAGVVVVFWLWDITMDRIKRVPFRNGYGEGWDDANQGKKHRFRPMSTDEINKQRLQRGGK